MRALALEHNRDAARSGKGGLTKSPVGLLTNSIGERELHRFLGIAILTPGIRAQVLTQSSTCGLSRAGASGHRIDKEDRMPQRRSFELLQR